MRCRRFCAIRSRRQSIPRGSAPGCSAALCLDNRDVATAFEILAEVEGEGFLDEEIIGLRHRVDDALRRTEQRDLIGSARRHLDLAEYPKAIGKAREAVELDPHDGEAQALKHHIEKEIREKQIEDWMAEARRHLEANAPQKAREVLDNVLRLRPNDPDALSLLVVITSREDKGRQVADEKARLYEAALESWEQGDIAATLERMNLLRAMERDQRDPARGASYEVFYDQLQAEQAAVTKAYEEAKAKAAAGDLDAALADCNASLRKYPSHAQFQALRSEVEIRRRQNRSASAGETLKKAEAEPDLDRRVALLEEALKRFPEDPELKRSLQHAREKRDLVNALIAKARTLEEQSSFAEALDQWQIVDRFMNGSPASPRSPHGSSRPATGRRRARLARDGSSRPAIP